MSQFGIPWFFCRALSAVYREPQIVGMGRKSFALGAADCVNGIQNIAESLQDPEPASLNNAYPDLNLWGGDNFFESVMESPQGGQAFIFQYSLKDGCHACSTGAFQRTALDFEPDGTYVGPRLLDVCKSDFPNDTVSIVTSVADLDVCPIRIAGF
ncbi:MAG: hypothetical protein IH983_14970 [Planctomycetes bacterium]|nr:hypothetical protein [Planctomycetota bacterium]